MRFCFKIFLIVFFSFFIAPQVPGVLGDNDLKPVSANAKLKAPKKKKSKKKKSKAQKIKAAKSSAGPQDEVSDQTEVSQQANESGKRSKK